jgi:Tfp pilus assembly protein PilO
MHDERQVMRARYADRIWLVTGAAVIALLVVAGWLLLINPKNVERHEVERQTEDTEQQVVILRARINELKRQQADLTTLQAALRKKQTALPSVSGVPAFLNQLQRAGNDADVAVTGITIGAATQLTDLTAVWALPITLTADGSMTNLERFVIALQTGQARALLIESARVSPQSDTAATSSATGTNTTASYVTADDAPGTGTTRDDAPGTTTPDTNTPDTNTPSTTTPNTNTPSTTTPSTSTPDTNTPSTTTPSTGTSGTNTPAGNTPSTGTTTGALSINLTLKAFVAPAADSGAPTTTTK